MALSPARAAAVAAAVVLLGGGALTLPRVMAGLPPVGADAPAYCRIARTLVGTGSLELPGPDRIDRDVQQDVASEFGTPYALTRDGRLFPKHSALFGILLAPGTAIGGTVGAQVSYLRLAAAFAAYLTSRSGRLRERAGARFLLLSLRLVPGGGASRLA